MIDDEDNNSRPRAYIVMKRRSIDTGKAVELFRQEVPGPNDLAAWLKNFITEVATTRH
jgi:hypothetical protein